MSLSTLSSKLVDNGDFKSITISNSANGFSMTVLNLGCTITSICVRDKDNKVEDVLLGYKTHAELIDPGLAGPYFGCIVGRVANRIDQGKFTLNDTEYTLAINNGKNALHGGLQGFDKKYFDVSKITESNDDESESISIHFLSTSADGEEGYPAALIIHITYTITFNVSKPLENTLEIDYNVLNDDKDGKATPINLTNHSYFNLSGDFKHKIIRHSLQLQCHSYTPVSSSDQIPSGEICDVMGSAFDFTAEGGVVIGERIPLIWGGGKHGIDHNFIVDGYKDRVAVEDEGEVVVRPCASLKDPSSGRYLHICTSQPGIQVYTANWLDDSSTASGPYVQYNGIALETQHWPDSINQPMFPSCVVEAGETYRQRSTYSFGCE